MSELSVSPNGFLQSLIFYEWEMEKEKTFRALNFLRSGLANVNNFSPTISQIFAQLFKYSPFPDNSHQNPCNRLKLRSNWLRFERLADEALGQLTVSRLLVF